MQNKKLAVALVTFAVSAFVLLAIFFLYEPVKQKFAPKDQAREEVTGDLPELVCEYADDQAAYMDAFERREINQCECIEDEKLRDVCKSGVMDVVFYDRALDQLDIDLCDNIYSEVQKEACVAVVTDAIADFEEIDPQYLADIYAMNHNEKAIGLLEELIAQGETSVENHISLALAYAEKGLKAQEQGSDGAEFITKALAAIDSAKGIDADDSEIYRVEGYVHEVNADFESALTAYDTAIEKNDKNILAYAGRGHVFRMMGALDEAIVDFTKAADLDPDNVYELVYVNLCNLEYSRSQYEDAIKNCKIVIKNDGITDPIFQSEAYQILSAIFADARDYTQAKNYLLQAKTISPNDANLYVTLSDLNLYEQNFTEAEENAREAIRLSSQKSAAYLALAKALYMQERYNDAIQAAQTGVDLVPNDVSLLLPSKPLVVSNLYHTIANNYRQMGDPIKQIEYEEKAEKALEEDNNLAVTQ